MLNLIDWAERGRLPDFVVRTGIRRLLAERLTSERRFGFEERQARFETFVDQLRAGDVAVQESAANRQHYEVPTEFFLKSLGPRLKYSCCLWDGEPLTRDGLAAAEERMLALTAERAGIEDGMEILDLGCGWGSFALWAAERFPNSPILAVSNSGTQRLYIEEQARRRGLERLKVLTANVATLDLTQRFDRVVSVEMLEHVRNYAVLFERISRWLRPDGKLFAHVFCHREFAYPFEEDGAKNWMGRHFFSGGIMPSENLLPRFSDHLAIRRQWRVNGTHYARTLETWLRLADANADELLNVFAKFGDDSPPAVQLQRWRMFFLACSELFGYRDGEEWYVAHYLFDNAAGRRESVG